MAFSGGNLAKVYANGYDLTSYLRKVSLPGSADAYDVTTFGKDHKVFLPGLKDAKFSGEGLYDVDSLAATFDKIEDVLRAALGVDYTIWSVFPAADALLARGRVGSTDENKWDIDDPVAGVVSVQFECQGASGPEPVISLHALSADAAGTTNGTAADNAAATANGGVGVLQAVAIGGGFSTATVKVQHSVDNSVWADLVTFTAITTAHHAERILVAAGTTVRRYLRYTVTATGGTFTHQVSFGRN